MRVLLADDHALFRAGLAALLEAWNVEIVGEAATGTAAVAAADTLGPDVVFMDLNMPDGGLAATRTIKALHPDVRVVILTVSDDENDLFDAVRSGAEGYLIKNLSQEEFAQALERLQRGEPVLPPRLGTRLLEEFARLGNRDAEGGGRYSLTPRERDVLEHAAKGAANKAIADALGVSEHTIHFHMKNIFSKLHVSNRAQVVAWAAENGYSVRIPKV